MKTDKTKLLQDIQAMKEKLASMEKELNKPELFKHFPSKDEYYYFYTSTGIVDCITVANDDLKVNVFKTKKEAQKAYDKAVALEKIKRRILELQGDWKPDWTDNDEKKICIQCEPKIRRFIPIYWFTTYPYTPIPYIKNEGIAELILYELEDELKLIFDIV